FNYPTIKMVKDKNKPKGAMTAYACFVQVIREEHRKKHPDETVVFSEFSKKCAEKWKTMNPKEKKRFEDMAARDKERHNREMEDYVPADGSKGRKRKRVKDPNMPKRPLSAFFFFCEEERPKVRASNPDWRVSEVAKELGRRWEACKNRPRYEQQAARDKLRYEEDMKQYKAGTFVASKRAKADATGDNGANAGDDDEDEDDEEEDDE
ncbi:hypothetical protein BOX15_Mlig025073g1, partial [Macrostomum lignano]